MYYKAVYNSYEGLKSHRNNFIYTPKKWHHKKETAYGNSFFVFTTLAETQSFINSFGNSNYEIWECKVKNPHKYDDELGYIDNYKNNAVFADSVMLTKRYVEHEQTYLEDGMVFRIKGKSQYLQYDAEDQILKHLSSNKYLEEYDYGVVYSDTVEELEDECDVVYCPKAKVKLTVTVTNTPTKKK